MEGDTTNTNTPANKTKIPPKQTPNKTKKWVCVRGHEQRKKNKEQVYEGVGVTREGWMCGMQWVVGVVGGTNLCNNNKAKQNQNK